MGKDTYLLSSESLRTFESQQPSHQPPKLFLHSFKHDFRISRLKNPPHSERRRPKPRSLRPRLWRRRAQSAKDAKDKAKLAPILMSGRRFENGRRIRRVRRGGFREEDAEGPHVGLGRVGFVAEQGVGWAIGSGADVEDLGVWGFGGRGEVRVPGCSEVGEVGGPVEGV